MCARLQTETLLVDARLARTDFEAPKTISSNAAAHVMRMRRCRRAIEMSMIIEVAGAHAVVSGDPDLDCCSNLSRNARNEVQE